MGRTCNRSQVYRRGRFESSRGLADGNARDERGRQGRACSPTATRSAARARRLAGARRARVRERRALGARARLPPHRHRPGLRQRGERRPGAARERRAARGGVHHDEVLSRAQGPGRRGRAEPAAARRRPRRPVHHPLAAGRPDVGVARHGAGARARPRSLDRRLQLQRRRARRSCSRRRTSPPVVNQVQFSPFEYRGRCSRPAREHGIALEAYSPLGTGRHLVDPTVAAIAERLGRTPAQVLLRWCLAARRSR